MEDFRGQCEYMMGIMSEYSSDLSGEYEGKDEDLRFVVKIKTVYGNTRNFAVVEGESGAEIIIDDDVPGLSFDVTGFYVWMWHEAEAELQKLRDAL